MTGYTPEQMSVMASLARGFATFDHWFSEVPSCTFPNRSFFHAATSSGYVVNSSLESFYRPQRRLDVVRPFRAAWSDLEGLLRPAIALLADRPDSRPRLRGRFATYFSLTEQFFEDAEKGELPTYAFIEPQIIGHAHNDNAPRVRHAHPRPHLGPPASLIAGEDLLARL